MKRTLLIVGLSLIILSGAGFFIFSKILPRQSKAALQVSSTPKAQVYLNNELVGETPYFSDQLLSGEYDLRLSPRDPELQIASWEGKITLVANIITSVNRQLGETPDLSSGEIVSLEKTKDKKTASLAIISIPDGALVKINNETKGFAPVVLENQPAADYQVVLSSPGYEERITSVHTVLGYQLNVSLKLAREKTTGVDSSASAEASNDADLDSGDSDSPQKPYVEILSTPTGWLRVRSAPSLQATEAGKVKPGETYPYLEEKDGDWYKIEYETDKEGWVYSSYIKLFE